MSVLPSRLSSNPILAVARKTGAFCFSFYFCRDLRPELCIPSAGAGKKNLAIFLNSRDLGALKRQVIHQPLRTKDEAHDGILDIGIIDLLARTQVD